MKKHHFISAIIALIILPGFLFAAGAKEEENKITVYATDSFCGDWGPGPSILEDFEASTGIGLELISAGSAMEMLSKVDLEKDKTEADVVIGITDDMASKAYEIDIFESYDAPALSDIPSFLIFDKEKRVLPYDYGNFAFVYDTEEIAPEDAPKSLDELLKPEFKDKFILIDPRTSSVGLGLLIWTIKEYGEESYLDWWTAAAENALTIADGWSTAYGLFTEGEAPIVLSYTTSPVYHVMWEDTTRYQALIFDNGHSLTIEGLGLVKSSDNKENAKVFIDYILTKYQLDIAVLNSMYPVNSAIELPTSYEWAPKPNTLIIEPEVISENLNRWLDDWTEAMRY